jgi:hypothetical protein
METDCSFELGQLTVVQGYCVLVQGDVQIANAVHPMGVPEL